MDVSVIIPAHNAEKTLGLQLQALTDQENHPAFEVIVVANCCSDGTVGVAERFYSSLNLKIVIANDLASAAYARNQGSTIAQGRYLLFCDADDQVQAGWVREMVRPLKAEKADFVGGLRIEDYFELPRWLRSFRPPSTKGVCLTQSIMPYAITASLAVTREAFDLVKGFDETYPGGAGEDRDFSIRLSRAGYRIGEAQEAVLFYRPRSTYRSLLKQERGYALSDFIFFSREGELIRTSFRDVLRRIVRTTGYNLLKKRTLFPTAYIFIFHSNICIWLDIRKYRRLFPAIGTVHS